MCVFFAWVVDLAVKESKPQSRSNINKYSADSEYAYWTTLAQSAKTQSRTNRSKIAYFVRIVCSGLDSSAPASRCESKGYKYIFWSSRLYYQLKNEASGDTVGKLNGSRSEKKWVSLGLNTKMQVKMVYIF